MTIASYILACAFWLLAALAFITLVAFVYVEVQYYHWNKQDRETNKLSEELTEQIAEQTREMLEYLESKIEDKIENSSK